MQSPGQSSRLDLRRGRSGGALRSNPAASAANAAPPGPAARAPAPPPAERPAAPPRFALKGTRFAAALARRAPKADQRAAGGSQQSASPANDAARDVQLLLVATRAALGQSEQAMAGRLGTTTNVIRALEKGQLLALPPWPETRRIVDQWVSGAGLDPRPALTSLASTLQAARDNATSGTKSGSKRAKKAATATSAAGNEPAKKRPWPRFARRLPAMSLSLPPSRVMRWGGLVVALAAVWSAATQTAVVAGAVARLPAPAERAVRSISDYLAIRFAPVREGHRWIDVEDPRSRRGDKLRIGRHSD